MIRYNWIGGGGHCIDLVETQGGKGQIDLDPGYRNTLVYGNIINNGPRGATTMIHYGGDQYIYENYRHGTLHFYDNTVLNLSDQRGGNSRYSTILFYLPLVNETGGAHVQESVDCHDNVFYNLPKTVGSVPSDFYLLSTNGPGTLNLGFNLARPGIQPFKPPYNAPFIGTISGLAQLKTVSPDMSNINVTSLPGLQGAGSRVAKAAGPFTAASHPASSTGTSRVSPVVDHTKASIPVIKLKTVGVDTKSVRGGVMVNGRVVLTGKATERAAYVSLLTSDPSVRVPSTVVIPIGTEFKSFSIPTLSVASARIVTITALLDGVSVTTTVTLQP